MHNISSSNAGREIKDEKEKNNLIQKEMKKIIIWRKAMGSEGRQSRFQNVYNGESLKKRTKEMEFRKH